MPEYMVVAHWTENYAGVLRNTGVGLGLCLTCVEESSVDDDGGKKCL